MINKQRQPTVRVEAKYDKEHKRNDSLFKSDTSINTRSIRYKKNAYKNKPQKTIHIFHNIKGDNIYVTYNNGIKVPVEYNREISGNKGIYVIERQHIPRISDTNIHGLKDYYSSGIEIEDEIIDDIVKLLTTGSDEASSDFIRHISFIPEYVIIKDESTFVPEHDILLSINDTKAKFPKTSMFNLVLEDGQININIFESRNPGKIYYSNAYGVVRKIEAKSGLINDGVYIYYKQNNRIKEIYAELSVMNSVGIYKTEEEALAHGDISSFMDVMKMQHQMKIMTYEEETLLLKLKSQIELTNLTLEEKRLSKLLIDERLKIEKIKQEGAIAKSRADAIAGVTKNLGTVVDIVSATGKIITKFI